LHVLLAIVRNLQNIQQNLLPKLPLDQRIERI